EGLVQAGLTLKHFLKYHARVADAIRPAASLSAPNQPAGAAEDPQDQADGRDGQRPGHHDRQARGPAGETLAPFAESPQGFGRQQRPSAFDPGGLAAAAEGEPVTRFENEP